MRRTSLAEKINEGHEKVTESGCWIWTGEILRNGYGRVSHRGLRWLAHRASYTLYVGHIPAGLTIDHLCKVKSCINPSHLEPVTHRENVLRSTGVAAVNAAKTHCIRGHALVDGNLYIQGTEGRARMCRQCTLDRSRDRYIATRNVLRPRKYV